MQVCGGFYQMLSCDTRSESWGVGHHVDSLVLVIRGGEFLKRGLHAPDLTSILGNGAITGELATSGNVVDHLLGPFLGVLMRG